jgi:hypothetical protein
MSVGLCPATRCSFDEEQGVLRISLKEVIQNEDGSAVGGQQVVVYALKVRSRDACIVRCVITYYRFIAGASTT